MLQFNWDFGTCSSGLTNKRCFNGVQTLLGSVSTISLLHRYFRQNNYCVRTAHGQTINLGFLRLLLLTEEYGSCFFNLSYHTSIFENHFIR